MCLTRAALIGGSASCPFFEHRVRPGLAQYTAGSVRDDVGGSRKDDAMTTYHFYTASSLDGFLADPDDGLGWLLSREFDETGPMNIPDFQARIGANVMGATTYEWLLAHGGVDSWPYEVPTFVFTHRELAAVNGDVRFVSGAPADHREVIESAAAERDVWVLGGGALAAAFADDGMLDELTVTFAPVFLGSGRPLYGGARELQLLEHAVNGEFLAARYAVLGPREA